MKALLLNIPYDSGQYKTRLGKGAERLYEIALKYLGEKQFEFRAEELSVADNLFPTEVTRSFEVNRALAQAVAGAVSKKELPLLFTGNCNTAIGTLAGLAKKNVGVIWFDCHGDFNTPETTVGGYLDGMALAMVTGRCWKKLVSSVPGFMPVEENNILLIGARDLDAEESIQLSHSLVRLVTPETLKRQPEVITENFPDVESVYLHIDLDVLDPAAIKVNNYATAGGLTEEELIHALDRIRNRYTILAITLTAYDSSLDPENKIAPIIWRILDTLMV